MSIIPNTGLVRKHYEDAIENIECRSFAFWIVVLNKHFNDRNTYSVTPESSPDGNLRCADIVVKRYDGLHCILPTLLWVECKRPFSSAMAVENQALDAADRCIKQDNLQWIWALTTIGVSFRLWFIAKCDESELRPVHGDGTRGDPSQYIGADSPAAAVFAHSIELIKENIPLREPIIVPSQPADT